MAKFSIISAVLALLAVGASASALPAPVDELIPGPGLPSLESLGLTRKDLLTMGPVKSLSPVALIYHPPFLTSAIVPEIGRAHV